MNGKFPIIVLAILLLTTGVTSATPDWRAEYTDSYGVEYSVSYDKGSEALQVTLHNPTNEIRSGPFGVVFDGMDIPTETPRLDPGERRRYTYDLTKKLNLTSDVHRLAIYTREQTLRHNYTIDITPSETTRYDTPKITDVSVETIEYRGEMRSGINVTAYNPTDRNWLLVVRAYTLETTGYYRGIAILANESSSETIILNEEPGDLVVGEVRMYEENISSKDKAFDQVEIKGRSSGETSWSHESYVPITPSWEDDDHYVYTNESVHREKIGAPETLRESAVAWVFGAMAVLYLVNRVR